MSIPISLESIFKVLKYVLIVFNVLTILGVVYTWISGEDFDEPELKNNHGVAIFAYLIVILFCTIGIIGAWRAHFALMSIDNQFTIFLINYCNLS
jgi:hypothetical protein